MTLPHGLRLLAAGILAIPALLLLVTIAPFVAVLSVPSLAILVRRRRDFATSPIISSLLLPRHSPPPSRGGDHPASSLDDDGDRIRRSPLLRHAIITGGSSGIGLSIAIELARRGCRNITLVARREDQLACARRSVEEAASAASDVTSNNTMAAVAVRTVSVDVTDHKALESSIEGLLVGGAFDGSRKDVQAMVDDERDSPLPGPPTLLFHCAGYSNPLAFVDHTASDFRDMVEVNYLGTVHVVMSVLPHMTNGGGGNMILTSSMSGQAGTYGYSAYSPTKFALRGFAECLSMELAANGSNVHVSLSYPPDTRTPGYENENRNKPEECRLISESAGVWDPDMYVFFSSMALYR